MVVSITPLYCPLFLFVVKTSQFDGGVDRVALRVEAPFPAIEGHNHDRQNRVREG